MKLWFGGFCVAFLALLFSSHLSAQSQLVTMNQIMITNHGIMVNIEGQLQMTSAVAHVGNGVYELNLTRLKANDSCFIAPTDDGILVLQL